MYFITSRTATCQKVHCIYTPLPGLIGLYSRYQYTVQYWYPSTVRIAIGLMVLSRTAVGLNVPSRIATVQISEGTFQNCQGLKVRFPPEQPTV
jgi:hypothetical protein